MFGMKPPLRLAIGALLLDGTPRAPQAIFEALLPDYPGERQLSAESVKRHLQALKVVGIVLASLLFLGLYTLVLLQVIGYTGR